MNTADRIASAGSSGVLNVAPQFFSDLNDWLVELFFLRAARLLDPADQNGFKNLTAEHLKTRLEHRGLTSAELTNSYAGLVAYGQLVRDAWRKLVAHSDLQARVSGVPMGSHTQEDYEGFRDDLQGFCDAVGQLIGVGPCDFITTAPGDISDLLHELDGD